MSRRLSLILSLTTLCAACSHQATLTTSQGVVEGAIIRSDAQMIYVERSESQPLAAVQRKEIIDIDHPGNVVATLGAVLAGTHLFAIAMGGMYLAAGGSDDYNQMIGALLLTQGIIVTAVGGAMLWWGYDAWSGSVSAAQQGLVAPRVSVGPTLLPNAQGQPRAGLGLSFTY